MQDRLFTGMSWLLLFACALVGGFTPNAGANEGDPTISAEAEALMVGDYLSYFTLPTCVCDDVSGNCYVKPSYTILNKLLAYINGATPGSEIRGHITSIGPPPKEALDIAQALINAHKRGVQVFLVHDGEEMQTPRGACGCENSGFSNVCIVNYDACNLGFRPLCDPLRGAAGGGCGGCICEWEEQPEGYKLEEYFGTRHKYCGAICEGVAVTSCVSCVTAPPLMRRPTTSRTGCFRTPSWAA